MSLSFRSVVMDIADIKVPFDSLPKTEKVKESYDFYRKYGLLDRQIIVDGDNVLRDGLVGLMVARAVDLKQLKVLQVLEKAKPTPAPEKTIALPDEATTADSSHTNTAATAAKAVEDIKKMREDAKVKQLLHLPNDIAYATELDVVCVKTGNDFTRGHVYHYKNIMTYDDYQGIFQGPYAVWALNNPYHARHVVPLVHRPAEVGEWVRVRDNAVCIGRFVPRDIVQVVARANVGGGVHVRTGTDHSYLSFPEYDVLEGYDGRYEPQEDANDM